MINTITGFFRPQETTNSAKKSAIWNLTKFALLSTFLLCAPVQGKAEENNSSYKGFNKIESPGLNQLSEKTTTLLAGVVSTDSSKLGSTLKKLLEEKKITDIKKIGLTSIVDFLYGLGVDSSFEFRSKLYIDLLLEGKYIGSAEQNTKMISALTDILLKEQESLIKNPDDSKEVSIEGDNKLPKNGTTVTYIAKNTNNIYSGKIVSIDPNENGGLRAVLQIETGVGKYIQFAVNYSDAQELMTYIVKDGKGNSLSNEQNNVTNSSFEQGDFDEDNISSLDEVNSKTDFINWLLPIIENVKDELGVAVFPSALVVAAGAYESGWGKSYSAKKRNNLFGLTGSNNKLMVFQNPKDSVKYYIELLTKSRYYKGFRRELSKTHLPDKKWISLMAESLNNIYAQGERAGKYSNYLLKIIGQNDLWEINS